MADLELQIILKAVDRFSRQTQRLQNSFERVDDRLSLLNRRAELVGRTFRRVGAAIVAFFGVRAIVGQFSALINASADFETALTRIAKTTGIEGQALRDLGEQFQLLSTEIPVSTSELGRLGEIAGQLGVQGSGNILKFVDTVARLGFATDLASDEAAVALAQIINVTGESIDSVDRLGATIVALGNNFATNEPKIARAATEIARATGVFGIGAVRATAFATALTAAGGRAEASGSALGRLFRTITEAVSEGGTELDRFARLVGLSTEEFVAAFRRDATDVVVRFIGALSELSTEEAVRQLASFKLQGDEISRALLPLIGGFSGPNGLTAALRLAGEAAAENAALTQESNRAFSTFRGFVERTGNAFTRLRQIAGARLLEQIKDRLVELLGALTGPAAVSAARRFGETLADLITRLVAFVRENRAAFEQAGRGVVALGGALVALTGTLFSFEQGAQSAANGLIPLQNVFGAIALLVAGLSDGVVILVAAFSALAAAILRTVVAGLRLSLLNPATAAIEVITGKIGEQIDELNALADSAQDRSDDIVAAFGRQETATQDVLDALSGLNDTNLGKVREEAERTAEAARREFRNLIDELSGRNFAGALGRQFQEEIAALRFEIDTRQLDPSAVIPRLREIKEAALTEQRDQAAQEKVIEQQKQLEAQRAEKERVNIAVRAHKDRIALAEDEVDAIRDGISDLNSSIKRLEDERTKIVEDAAKDRKAIEDDFLDTQRSIEAEIRDIRREGLSEEAAQADIVAEINDRLTRSAQELAAARDAQAAQAARDDVREARSLIRQLEGERTRIELLERIGEAEEQIKSRSIELREREAEEAEKARQAQLAQDQERLKVQKEQERVAQDRLKTLKDDLKEAEKGAVIPVEVEVSPTIFDKIRALEELIRRVKEEAVKIEFAVDPDTGKRVAQEIIPEAAAQELARLRQQLAEAKAEAVIQVKADTEEAEDAIETVKEGLEDLQEQKIEVEVTPTGRTVTGGNQPPALFQHGGDVPGTGRGDRVRALLEPGEFVVRRDRAQRFGALLEALNSMPLSRLDQLLGGRLPRLRAGGRVGGARVGFQTGGPVAAQGPTDRVELDLRIGGRGVGSLTGSRDTVDALVGALQLAQKELAGG